MKWWLTKQIFYKQVQLDWQQCAGCNLLVLNYKGGMAYVKYDIENYKKVYIWVVYLVSGFYQMADENIDINNWSTIPQPK